MAVLKKSMEDHLEVVLPEGSFERRPCHFHLTEQGFFPQLLLHLLPFPTDLPLQLACPVLLLHLVPLSSPRLVGSREFFGAREGTRKVTLLFFYGGREGVFRLGSTFPESYFFGRISIFFGGVLLAIFAFKFVEPELAGPGQFYQLSIQFPFHSPDQFLSHLNCCAEPSLPVKILFGGPFQFGFGLRNLFLDAFDFLGEERGFSLICFCLQVGQSGSVL